MGIMVMSRIISSKTLRNGDLIELAALDSSWDPWGYQINRKIQDGKHYGSPGRPIYTSMHNFILYENAEASYNKISE